MFQAIPLSHKSNKIKQKGLVWAFFLGSLLAILLFQPKIEAATIFDGSRVENWSGKQNNSSCGSSLTNVDTSPPNLTTTSSIEVFLKDGCLWNGNERVELATTNGQFYFHEGDVWYIDFWQRFDQLAVTHPGSAWDIWMQTHYPGGGSQPNIQFATGSLDDMQLKTSTGCDSTTVWNGGTIEVGKWYHFTLGVKFSADPSIGWVELYVDENKVLDKTNVAVLGTSSTSCPGKPNTVFDATTGYLKKGIYRNSNHSGDQKYAVHNLLVFDESPYTEPSPTPEVTLTAESSTIPLGTSTSLAWSSTENPLFCEASGAWSGLKDLNGAEQTIVFNEPGIYEYTLSCLNENGVGTATTNISVQGQDPPVVSIATNLPTINSGQTVDVNWSTQNSPQNCEASGDWSGMVGVNGSWTSPELTEAREYLFTITCFNPYGVSTETVSVVVLQVDPPTISINSSQSTIYQGQSTDITWSTVNNPESCEASGDWSGIKTFNGNQSTNALNEIRVYSFTLTCNNAGGTSSESVSVTVIPLPPKPSISMSLSSPVEHVDGSLSINWSTQNSPQNCEASGDWSGIKTFNGNQTLESPTQSRTHTYTLSCSNDGGTTSVSVASVVLPKKPLINIYLVQPIINTGGKTDIKWTVAGSPSSCSASGNWSGAKTSSGTQSTGKITSGTVKTYTLSCVNAGGKSSASVSLSVSTSSKRINTSVSRPVIDFSIAPSTVMSGANSNLSWSVIGASPACTGSGDWTGTKSSSGNNIRTALTATKTFTLTCTNAGGSTSSSVTVSVVSVATDGSVKVNGVTVPNLLVPNRLILGAASST